MIKSTSKRLREECLYCTKKIGRSIVSPNILLYVLAYNDEVISYLLMHHTDMQLFWHIVKPVHKRKLIPPKVTFSSEVSDFLQHITEQETNLSCFKRFIQESYIQAMLSLCSFQELQHEHLPYLQKVIGGSIVEREQVSYKKIDNHLFKRNVMIIGEKGSGRETLIRNYAAYRAHDFQMYQLDLFRYIKQGESKTEDILQFVFKNFKNSDCLYFPNFLTIVGWLEKLHYTKALLILEENCGKGNIITQANSSFFDSKQFYFSKLFQFHCLTQEKISPVELTRLLQAKAIIFELFYSISLPNTLLNAIQTFHFNHDRYLAEPGRSVKKLMALALSRYAEDSHLFDFSQSSRIQNQQEKLQATLKREVIGQTDAIQKIIENYTKRFFYFYGPPGTGKLKTARILAHELFGVDSFRYFNATFLLQYPQKIRWQEKIREALLLIPEGVLYIENFHPALPDHEQLLTFIKSFLQERDQKTMVIFSFHDTSLVNQTAIDLQIEFQALSTKDLENLINKLQNKLRNIKTMKSIDPFALSIQAQEEQTIWTIKKVLEESLS